jgi:hypothetical protein
MKRDISFIAFLALLSVAFLVSPMNSFFYEYQVDTPNSALASKLCHKKMGVLYGIFSMAHKEEARRVIRQKSQCDFNNGIHKTIFVVGKPRNQRDYEIIMRESKLYRDIFILTSTENMNMGKSYTYFKEALEKFPCFKFYAKVDDDTAFLPNKISATIMSLPNNSPMYYGRISELKCSTLCWISKMFSGTLHNVFHLSTLRHYSAGMLYILNKQAIVEWVTHNPHPIRLYGDEDLITSYYMGQISATGFSFNTSFHDYYNYQPTYTSEHWRLDITSDSQAVHQCKKTSDLSDALTLLCGQTFNQTTL